MLFASRLIQLTVEHYLEFRIQSHFESGSLIKAINRF